MRFIKITSRKDWIIAFVFTSLVVYGVSSHYSFRLQSFLLTYGNSRLTNMNQPRGYANLMVVFLVMTLITEIILFLYHKSWVKKLVTALAGVILTLLIWAGYLINCDLIVSVIHTSEPSSIHVGGWGHQVDVTMNEEQKEQLITYCETLQPVNAQKERALEAAFHKSGFTSKSILIWSTYPRKYGHNYDLMVCVYQDMIFIRKGYNGKQEIVTFYEDNGILDLLQEITA